MILPNTEMQRAQLREFIAAANAAATAGKLAHGPFLLFDPSLAGTGNYFELPPPYVVTDRGSFIPGTTYNAGDQVGDGYLFISVVNANTSKPLDDVTGKLNAGWREPWHSCYNRIRADIGAAATQEVFGSTPLNQWSLSVSGPWPCERPSTYYDRLAFYYEDTGLAEHVTLNAGVSGQLPGKAVFAETGLPSDLNERHGGFDANGTSFTDADHTVSTALPGRYRFRYVKENEFSVVFGGTQNATADITFSIGVGFLAGLSQGNRASDDGSSFETVPTVFDEADPTGKVEIDTSQWFPGASFVADAFAGYADAPGNSRQASVLFRCRVTGTIAPGRYTVRFRVNADPANRGTGTLTGTNDSPSTAFNHWSGFLNWAFDTFGFVDGTLLAGLTAPSGFTIVSDQSVTVPGISDRKAVKKIEVTNFGVLGPPILMGGIEFLNYAIDGTPGPVPNTGLPSLFEVAADAPVIESGFAFEKLYDMSAGAGFSASTVGYWLGKTPPVQSLGLLPFEDMPWNKFPVTFPATGANTAAINHYLGYIPPYVHGRSFDNFDSQRAYQGFADAPAWLTTITSSNANELLPCPKRWKAQVHYPTGFTIIDSYGNLHTAQTPNRSGNTEPVWPQTLGAVTQEPDYTDAGGSHHGILWKLTKVLRAATTLQRDTAYALDDTGIDDNGNLQKCTQAGTTGASNPDWSTTVAGVTNDGTAKWALVRTYPRLIPPVAKLTPPIYPFFWQNPVSDWTAATSVAEGETVTDAAGNTQRAQSGGVTGALAPAWNGNRGGLTTDGTVTWEDIILNQPPLTDDNQDFRVPLANPAHFPFSFRPQGWWIYRVSLNRIPQKKSREQPSSEPISVQLGCIRNGVFVAFGTYQTGQIIDAGWFVFTNTAIAVRASERIEIQADMATCGLGYSMWGPVHFPMCAAFITDLNAVLGIL